LITITLSRRFELNPAGNHVLMAGQTESQRNTVADARDEPTEVRTVELEDEDGNPVVIAQQNAGPGNQVGDGEFKKPHAPKDPGEAAEEQANL
jgi:hypothetical protein